MKLAFGMLIAAAILCAAGCGSGSTAAHLPPTTSGALPQAPTAIPTSGTAGVKASARAAFVFRIPRALGAQSKQKRPRYVSVGTSSISIALTAVNSVAPSPQPMPQVVNVTSTSDGCQADPNQAGNTLCTITLDIPVGTDTLTVSTYDANDAAGHLLSQQIYAASVAAGVANTFNFSLDANPGNAAFTVSSTGGATAGSQHDGFTITTTGAAQTFALSLTDAAGYTLVGPGQPVLSASSSATAVATVGMSGGTLTITPVSAGAAAITVTGAPANSQVTSDGLSNGSATFGLTVATPAPAAPLFAVAGTNASNSPQSSHVYLYSYSGSTLTLSGTISDTTLGQSGMGTDPNAVAFDSSGNLFEADQRLNHILFFAHSTLTSTSPSVTRSISQGVIKPYSLSTAPDGSVLAALLSEPQYVEFSPAGQLNNTVTSQYNDSISGGIAGTFIPGAAGFATDSVAVITSSASTSSLAVCNGTPANCSPTILTSNVSSPNYGISYLAWDSSIDRLYLANTRGGGNGGNNLKYYAFNTGMPSSATTVLGATSRYRRR